MTTSYDACHGRGEECSRPCRGIQERRKKPRVPRQEEQFFYYRVLRFGHGRRPESRGLGREGLRERQRGAGLDQR